MNEESVQVLRRDGSSGTPSHVWDKLKTLSGVTASIVVPLVIALTGHWYSKALKEREIQIRYHYCPVKN